MNTISAYIPCLNNEASVLQAINSIIAQTLPVAELFVIDDGSTDNSVKVAKEAGITVLQNKDNQGRGAVRAKALLTATNELVLTVDANKMLAANFLEHACQLIDAPNVAAVHGILIQPDAANLADRWRGRHLFKTSTHTEINHKALHFSGGALLKRSIAMQLGNYDDQLRYSEDKDLGVRLLQAGYDVICDPELLITATCSNNLAEVLERYWRWHEDSNDHNAWLSYMRQIAYATKVMAAQDLSAGDPLSVPISLISPHYQFWRSWWQKHVQR